MMEKPLSLGQNIRHYRTSRGMTQETLGRLVGAAKHGSRSYVSHIERDPEYNMTLLKLRRFAAALQVSAHDLIPSDW